MKLSQLFETNYGSLIDPNKYNSMDHAEQMLYRYTADGYAPPSGSDFEQLEEEYPFDGGVLYRGLLFSEVKDFDKFMANIEDGEIKMDNSSSWTPSVSTALSFARSEKTYFPSREIMAAYSATQKAGDHMSGEGGGVVLSTSVEKGTGIDVDKTSYGKESEVLLPAGTYQIKVHKILRPFRVTHNTATKANEMANEVVHFIETGEGDEAEIKKYVHYLENSWLDELTPTQVDAMIQVNHKFDLVKAKARLSNTKVLDYLYDSSAVKSFNGAEIRGGLFVPVSKKLFDAASPKMQNSIVNFLKLQIDRAGEQAKSIADDLQKRLDSGEFKIHSINVDGFSKAEALDSKLAPSIDKALKPLKQFFSNAYHHLNSREYNKTINAENIKDHAKLMSNIVKVMSSF